MLEELNKEMLKRLYIKEQRALRDIAQMYGCSSTLVRYRCVKYKIKLRPKAKRSIKLKRSVLQRLCVKEGKSSKKIAEMLSCSSHTVLKRCREYGIPLRGQKRIKGLTKSILERLYVKEGKTVREIAKIIGCSREPVRLKCKQFDVPLRTPGSKKLEIDVLTLRRLYVKEGKSITEIAKIFSCAISTISQRIKRFGLKRELEV